LAEAKDKPIYASVKEHVFDMFENNPQFSNKVIANTVGCSQSYVYRLLGPNREQQNVQRKADVLKHAQGLKGIVWNDFQRTRTDFVKNFLPIYEYPGEKKTEDFDYFLPTDDAMANSGTGEDLSGSWSQYEYLSEQRIGIGPKVTMFPAKDAILNGFKFLDKKTGEEVKTPKIDKWVEDTDFLNEFAQAIYYERVYGISFLLMYFSEDDKARGVLNTEIKKSEGQPVAFEAHAPTILTPIDTYKSDKLNKNPQKWNLRGGYFNPQEIHYSRVRVLMSRPKTNRWYGLSIWEPIWDSSIPYYQALIFLLRGFAKWGNTIAKYIIPLDEDLEDLYTKYGDVIEEMKMNGTYIGPAGSDISFEPTQLGTGLREMMDIWIEDISSGTGIPVPILMGRVVASGLGNNGYAIMERYYWNMIQKIQRSFTDDVLAILKVAGFDTKDLKLDWNLSITKTDMQRLEEELMEREVRMADKELELMDLELEGKALENEAMEIQNITALMTPEGEEGDNKTPTPKASTAKDFRERRLKRKKRREDLMLRYFGIDKDKLAEVLGEA
jgi:hypothetical protein